MSVQDREWVEFPCGHRWQGVFRDPPICCPLCESSDLAARPEEKAMQADRALPRFPLVREQRIWRQLLLTPVCLIRGHVPALIRPIIPNPYATESWVEGCGRCSRCPL